MRLIVGLGNPGPGYAGHRHNIGFMAADEIRRRYGFGPWRSRFHGLVSEGEIGGEKIVLLKPETYMNDSGRAVAAAAQFYKLEPPAVIAIHDEIELVPGKVRVKQGGGAAGHNGLRSMDAHIGPPTGACGWGWAIPAIPSWCATTCCRISPRRSSR